MPSLWEPRILSYLKFQMERAPTTGALHLQGVMVSRNSTTVGSLKSGLGQPTLHLEKARAWSAAVAYAGKEETRVSGPWEWGSEGQGGRTDLKSVLEAAAAGKRDREIAEADPVAFARNARPLQAWRMATAKAWSGERQVALFWGGTGTGKSRTVADYTPPDELYRVLDARKGWFDGYQGETTALFDECGPESVPSIDYLKQLLDRYPMRVQIKGGSVAWNTRRIILCSNNPIERWYPLATDADLQALKRRIRVFFFPTDRRAARRWMLQDLPRDGVQRPIPVDSESEADDAAMPSPITQGSPAPVPALRTWRDIGVVDLTQEDAQPLLRMDAIDLYDL